MDRVFFCSGPGNIIESHECWKRNQHNPEQVSLTFSGQVQDFCRNINATAYFVAKQPSKKILRDGPFTLEHRPKADCSGPQYHLNEIFWGLGLLWTALRFRARIAIVESGATHYFVLILFRLCGMRVIPVLHNPLWPPGFPRRKLVQRVIQRLDSFFWRWGPAAVIAVSPECERQVDQLRRTKCYPIFQMRAQFDPTYFTRIPVAPPHSQRPFRVLFVGRMIRSKGIFDLLQIARAIENTDPGLVVWELCGGGPDLEELRQLHRELQLGDVVQIHGWTSPSELVKFYGLAHVCIVPTKGSLGEGFAMTAAEAILARRPLITSPVVPALEVLKSACVEARTDDLDSYVRAVLRLAKDEDLYNRVRAACDLYADQFYDQRYGYTAVLKQAVDYMDLHESAPASSEAVTDPE